MARTPKKAKPTGSLADDPVFRYRVPVRFQGGRTVSSREIDAALYGKTTRTPDKRRRRPAGEVTRA